MNLSPRDKLLAALGFAAVVLTAFALSRPSTPGDADRAGPSGTPAAPRDPSTPHDDAAVPIQNPGPAPLQLASLRAGEPVPREIAPPAGGPRVPVSVMALDDDPPTPDDLPEEEPVEASDLDEDHPGAYWSNAGFTTLRAVAEALGVHASRAWVDSPSGELLLAVPTSDGAERLISVSPDAIPADLTGDNRADLRDLTLFLAWLGEKSPRADVNDDGATDAADLTRFLRAWSPSH